MMSSKLAIAAVLAGSVWTQNPVKQQPPLAKPPIIIQNHDGTLTAQKEPPKDAKPGSGLIIPKQVVIPITVMLQVPKH